MARPPGLPASHALLDSTRAPPLLVHVSIRLAYFTDPQVVEEEAPQLLDIDLVTLGQINHRFAMINVSQLHAPLS